MTATREQIYTALFNKLVAATGVVTAARRVQLWDQIADTAKPALFTVENSEEYQYQSENLPHKIVLNVTVLLYTAAGQDITIIPATQLNNLLDAIDAALAPDIAGANRGKQTLGGLVSHCRIEGSNPKDDGALDGNGVAIRQIKIFLP